MVDSPHDALAARGFDLAHAFDTAAVAHEPGLAILGGAERLGILIGNTRALWPPFVAAMRDPALATEHDPLERYTERAIESAYPGARIYYGHRHYELDGTSGFLPLQRLAIATGLGALGDGGLVIHPVYGPWIALRAVVVLDGAPVARSPIEKPCDCGTRCGEAARRALAARGPDAWRAWLAVRDSCTVSAWRYSDDQIRYHYTKTWS